MELLYARPLIFAAARFYRNHSAAGRDSALSHGWRAKVVLPVCRGPARTWMNLRGSVIRCLMVLNNLDRIIHFAQ